MDGPRCLARSAGALLSTSISIGALLAIPAAASAETVEQTYTVGPVSVGGYEVAQDIRGAPDPNVDGFITKMEVDVVDGEGEPIPISRLMLHHIVFVNVNEPDATCDSLTGWDDRPMPSGFARQRFYAAGEERAKLALPEGYGYPIEATDSWAVLYMLMNHRAVTDQAYIQYKVTVDDDPALEPVEPYWLDVQNCHADPIYNVPGDGAAGSTHVRSEDFTIPRAGRLVAAGGHVHGGARKLTLTQPDCGDRKVGESVPLWGRKDHPFYKVRPILHEPGPIGMSAFDTETGIPISKDSRLRLSSRYDNSLPHARVMGIMIAYVAHDPSVRQRCGPLPHDVRTLEPSGPGRRGPVPFEVPLTGLDENGDAVEILKPPGDLRRMPSGSTIDVGNFYFSHPNVSVRRGARLSWRFGAADLHNVTLANGPRAIGSPNLDDGREFSQRLRASGTYRLFCSLHPVTMAERVVVRR